MNLRRIRIALLASLVTALPALSQQPGMVQPDPEIERLQSGAGGAMVSPDSTAPGTAPGYGYGGAQGYSSSGAPAQGLPPIPQIPLKPGEMLFNFQDADIAAVAKTVSLITGRNFLIDPRVKGKLTIISTKPVNKNAVYQIFLAALKAQGFIAIPGPNGVQKVVPLGEAKQGVEVQTGKLSGSEQLVTHVVSLSHGSASLMMPMLRPLMAPTSQISVYSPSNSLIITDFAENIRSLLKIVKTLDQRGGSEIVTIPMKSASAVDVADVITRLYPHVVTPGQPAQPGAPAGEGERVIILPDLRTNSLLVRADNPGTLIQLRTLIEKLDVPANQTGSTRVVYLKNAEATKLAETLRGLLKGEAQAAQAAQAAAGGAARAVGGAKGAESSLVQADEGTNALIISAPDAIFNNLRSVIEQLDVRRAQVFVEALIAEISADDARQLGFQWAIAGAAGSGAVGGMQNFIGAKPSLGAVAADPLSAAAIAGGLSVAFLGPEVTLPDGRTVRGIGALARAVQDTGIGNVIATPNILTLDNAEAKIVVAENLPFVTGQFITSASTGGTSGVSNPFQTIERKDVGLTLKIKPQISEGGTVRLVISQEASTVNRAATALAGQPVTKKRSIDTTVTVDDGATIVLGGLLDNQDSVSESKVPLLGDLPGLGWLFRYQEKSKTKTNLMVFLKPTIVRNAEDTYSVTTNRYEYMRALRKNDVDSMHLMEPLEPRKPEPKVEPMPAAPASVPPAPAPVPQPAPEPPPAAAPAP